MAMQFVLVMLVDAQAVRVGQGEIASNTAIISDFTGLIEELKPKIETLEKLDDLRSMRGVQELSSTRNRRLFRSMVLRTQEPAVWLAGLYCLNEHFPEEAPVASLWLVSTAEKPFSPLYAPVYEILEDALLSDALDAALTALLASPHVLPLNLQACISGLKKGVLSLWFSRHSDAVLPVNNEAVLLDGLLGDAVVRDEANLKQRVQQLRDVPGYPRYVYVLHGSPHGDGYLEYLKLVLQDSSLDDISVMALIRHRRPLVGSIVSELVLPANRRELIERVLMNVEKTAP